MADVFYIWCSDVEGDHALWWKSNRNGYTTALDDAGLYSVGEASRIAAIRGTDIPVPESVARSLVVPRVRTSALRHHLALGAGKRDG